MTRLNLFTAAMVIGGFSLLTGTLIILSKEQKTTPNTINSKYNIDILLDDIPEPFAGQKSTLEGVVRDSVPVSENKQSLETKRYEITDKVREKLARHNESEDDYFKERMAHDGLFAYMKESPGHRFYMMTAVIGHSQESPVEKICDKFVLPFVANGISDEQKKRTLILLKELSNELDYEFDRIFAYNGVSEDMYGLSFRQRTERNRRILDSWKDFDGENLFIDIISRYNRRLEIELGIAFDGRPYLSAEKVREIIIEPTRDNKK